MSLLGTVAELAKLAEVGLDKRAINKAIAESLPVRTEVIRKAKEVRDYWQSIAPVNKTGKPHTLPSGYVDEPGDYRDSIRITYQESERGLEAKVTATDWKARWIEYGTSRMPEYACAQKTVDHFGGNSTGAKREV